ncbi:p-loop containing nucleoside triphosphate hydrolase [Venustampulla echinocandica]|uniref:p-loop containing nucleoside triphosphate hydrolase n=1 Tax=Venustampulla echinocandica TaxID=2656787 RepID=A0A370TGF8_9HELO|nr:p-loop containing nucleoside triphosphate hydrolase [Venustampulla echinocandica]RDL33971.1 p-loop containing nucleoside triphosphate hydrolase [Venustampulla echinocandica]
MPILGRAVILTSTSSLPIIVIRPQINCRSLSTTASFSLSQNSNSNSHFHRSDFQGNGYSTIYEPGQPTKGPLAQSSRYGVLRLTPLLLKEHLDKFVVGQDKAKKVTSVAIYSHYQRIREIRRQELEEQERRAQKARQEWREREPISHPVENEYPGHPETVNLNASQKPEAEIGTRPLEDLNTTIIEKSNLLLLGPSGVGKTYILQTLARVLEVPFATVDCSSLTQAGYIGTDIESSIERLLLASSHSISKCEAGIIFFDEVDKLAKPAVMTHGRDVSGEGVQQGLLKMIEGTTVTVNAKPDRNSKTENASGFRGGSERVERGGAQGMTGNQTGKSEQYTIDTSNILFVFAGAFVGLEKIISKRLSSGSSIGFGAQLRSTEPPPVSKPSHGTQKHHFPQPPPPNTLAHVTTADLQAYGLIPELLGRIPITVSLAPLSLPQLVSILTEPRNSLVKQYTALFNTFGVQLRFTTAALHAIASKALGVAANNNNDGTKSPSETAAAGGGIGARGLRSILESVLQETMFWAPGSSIRFCLIDEHFVESHYSSPSRGHDSGVDEEGGDKDKAKMPRCWSRGQSQLFEEAYEKEELDWDARVNGGPVTHGGFEQFREVGSSGM